jgi:hypothetical protein
MKWLVVSSMLVSSFAFADAAPPQWRLPNEGRNCVFRQAFEPSKITCGSERMEMWTCVTPAKERFGNAVAEDYLIVGEYGSDVGNGCSPTFFVKRVLKQQVR